MANHPIEGLMKTAMESIKIWLMSIPSMDPVETPERRCHHPVSRVPLFSAGGSEFESMRRTGERRSGDGEGEKMPLAAAAALGYCKPRSLSGLWGGNSRASSRWTNVLADRLIDLHLPQFLGKVQNMLGRGNRNKEETLTLLFSAFTFIDGR